MEVMARTNPRHATVRSPAGVEGNARLTSALGASIFVLLFVEGITILQIIPMLYLHVFIGVVLIPISLTKIASTSWRFFKYYAGNPEYRQKGPPLLLLRLLGPIVIVLTIIVLATGVGLVLLPTSLRGQLFFLHQASFVLWLIATTVHVLGHVIETAKLAPQDWFGRSRRQVRQASTRQWVVVISLVLGVLLALVISPHYGHWWCGVAGYRCT